VPIEKQGLIFAPFEQADASTTRNMVALPGSVDLGRFGGLMGRANLVESPWVTKTDGKDRKPVHFTVLSNSARKLRRRRPIPSFRLRISRCGCCGGRQRRKPEADSRLLEKRGHSVSMASNGLEAWRAWPNSASTCCCWISRCPNWTGWKSVRECGAARDYGSAPADCRAHRACP